MPRKRKKKSKEGRVWLNSNKGSHAHVAWRMDSWTAEFSIMDCTRVVTLDFGAAIDSDLHRDSSARDAWKKLERLEKELAKFRAALEEAAGKDK